MMMILMSKRTKGENTMHNERQYHIHVMKRELDYLYEILDGSESKSEKLLVLKKALKLFKHIEEQQKTLAREAAAGLH